MPVRNLPGGSHDDPHRQRRPGEPRRSSSARHLPCRDRDAFSELQLLPHLAVLRNITLLDAGAAAVGETKMSSDHANLLFRRTSAPNGRHHVGASTRAGASFPGQPDPPETQQSERE